MNAVFEAAKELGDFLAERGWRYCLIGGMVVPRWGEARTTQDVDIHLLTGFGSEERYIDALLQRFPARLPDARQFALENRILLAKTTKEVGLDIALAGFPFEERMIERSSPFAFTKELTLLTASAEDLIIMKALAGRPQDWLDIQGVVTRQGKKLDWHYIEQELPSLSELFDNPNVMEQLQEIRQRLEAP